MNQIPFKTERGSFLAVEVPEDATDIQAHWGCLTYFIKDEGTFRIQLEQKDWIKVGLLSDVTESRADSIVDTFGTDLGTVFKEYGTDRRVVNTALESFNSLLKANGIDQDKHFLILKEKV